MFLNSSLGSKCFSKLDRMGLLKWVPDSLYLKMDFYRSMGYKLDLVNPKSFNEKLQWIKLNDRKNIYTTMVDKYEVKNYVSSIIGERFIVRTLGVWDKFDDIIFGDLPNRFVLKCTHDSGGIVICRDKNNFDITKAKSIIQKSLKCNYYFSGREWPYKNVVPRIIAEEYLADDLQDYKFFCFNGEPKMVLVCSERFSENGLREDFFDLDWNHMPLERTNHPNSDKSIKKPHCLEEMVVLASKLSEDTIFSRIDFYEINNRVYFGEITFFPSSGNGGFKPKTWDFTLGSWLKLPITE